MGEREPTVTELEALFPVSFDNWIWKIAWFTWLQQNATKGFCYGTDHFLVWGVAGENVSSVLLVVNLGFCSLFVPSVICRRNGLSVHPNDSQQSPTKPPLKFLVILRQMFTWRRVAFKCFVLGRTNAVTKQSLTQSYSVVSPGLMWIYSCSFAVKISMVEISRELVIWKFSINPRFIFPELQGKALVSCSNVPCLPSVGIWRIQNFPWKKKKKNLNVFCVLLFC